MEQISKTALIRGERQIPTEDPVTRGHHLVSSSYGTHPPKTRGVPITQSQEDHANT